MSALHPSFPADRRSASRSRCVLGPLLITLLPVLAVAGTAADWAQYLGGPDRQQYSPLDQITTGNVQELEVAWTYRTGVPGQVQCNPLVVDGVLYAVDAAGAPYALDAATGTELWRRSRDALTGRQEDLRILRGLTLWTSGDARPRLFYTAGPWLHALDAGTGEPVPSFGTQGRVSLRTGLGSQSQDRWVISTTPGARFEDLIIMPLRVSEESDAAHGSIQAYDVRTGELAWVFHTIPRPGEAGHDTWPEKAHRNPYVGGANSWAGMAVDEEHGLVFVPTGSASPDFWGGHRAGDNLFANSLLALDARTGERRWHFQFVHHDIWDRDLPAPPVLLTLQREGEAVPAVAQTTKDGFVYVFNRLTGEPLFPIEELPAPPSPLAGETTAPTQPRPVRPAPFARQHLGMDDISPYARNREELLAFRRSARHGRYEPFGADVTLLFPGFDGGAEWGGPAVDPEGVLYVNSNEMAWIARLVPTEQETAPVSSLGEAIYRRHCLVCHGADRSGNPASRVPTLEGVEARLSREEIETVVVAGRGMMPGFPMLDAGAVRSVAAYLRGEAETTGAHASPGTASVDDHPGGFTRPPYRLDGYEKFLDDRGYPAISPPWGTLTAIDLQTGEHRWQVTLGDFSALSGPAGAPSTGTENYGGPVVTAGNLLFIAATKDGFIRAFDRRDGRLLWEHRLPAAGFATPAIYAVNGRQFVVIAAGGTKLGTPSGDYLVAFALPDADASKGGPQPRPLPPTAARGAARGGG